MTSNELHKFITMCLGNCVTKKTAIFRMYKF